jgi:hypothetical protein
MKTLNVARTCGIVGTILTLLFVLVLTTACNSGPVGPKRTIPKFLSIKTSVSGLKDETILVTTHIYNLDTGKENTEWKRTGNGPSEISIREPKEGHVYTIIAEAEGYTVQPESYRVRITDDNAAVITNNETGEEASRLDFQFIFTPPAEPSPGTPELTNDDVVSAPGGFTYRAGIHQQGEPDWPPVQQTDVTLDALSGTIDIQYRDFIETKAGETRNNIIFLNGGNAPELSDPLQVQYRAEGLPDGITLERDREMYGGIGGQDKTSSRVVLEISIAPEVTPGEYPFSIQLEYEGKDFGSIPCTIQVTE